MSRKKYLLFGGILRSGTAGRLVRWLRDGAGKRDDRSDFLRSESAAIRRHHRGFSHGAAAKRDDVLHEFVALGVQRGAIVQQRRNRGEIRTRSEEHTSELQS